MSKRSTSNGVRLEDVIRSGLRHPESTVGIYAPDAESYKVFRELFGPILQSFQAPSLAHNNDLACLNRAAVVSTRIRMARNLSGHAFPAGMSRAERLSVEGKIAHACRSLAPGLQGEMRQLQDIPDPQLGSMISAGLAFGPEDKYMAAAGIHSDWPIGRSVFTTQTKEVSVWINEEDHLRVAVVLPGACLSACYQKMVCVMSHLAAHLDFSADAELGYLTSCPSNVGSAMRASYRVDLRQDASQQPLLERLETAGVIQIRGTAGEHARRTGRLADVSFRHRVGISEAQMQQDMDSFFANA